MVTVILNNVVCKEWSTLCGNLVERHKPPFGFWPFTADGGAVCLKYANAAGFVFEPEAQGMYDRAIAGEQVDLGDDAVWFEEVNGQLQLR